MAINLDAVRQKLQAIQDSQTRKGSSKLWKPSDPVTIVRILPSKFDSEYPFTELLFHFIFKKPVISLASFNEADPVVELAEQLKRTGDKADFIESRKMEPKTRIYVPIIIRGKEDEGIKYWGFGKEVYQELLNYISDPDYGDFTDLHEGRDLTVTFTQAKDSANGFASTSVRLKPNMTPAATSKDDLKALIEDQVEITSLFTKPSYDELVGMLEEYVNPAAPNTSDEEKADTTAVARDVKSVSEIQKDFKKFFNGSKNK